MSDAVFLTPEMLAALINNGLGGVAIVLLFNVNSKLGRITDRLRDHETRLRAIERRVLLPAVVAGCALLMCGCDVRQVKIDAMKTADGVATGLLSGGPVGAVVGGIASLLGIAFGAKEREKRKRRDRVISHYRDNVGDIDAIEFEKIKTNKIDKI